jgi:anti-sigma B factor antagonist
MRGPKPKIMVEYIDSITIVTFTSDRLVDQPDIKAVEESILRLIADTGPTYLVLDFTKIAFLSSAALGALIKILSAVNKRNGEMRLCAVDDKVAQIFKITRLNKVFDIYPDATAAVKSIPL